MDSLKKKVYLKRIFGGLRVAGVIIWRVRRNEKSSKINQNLFVEGPLLKVQLLVHYSILELKKILFIFYNMASLFQLQISVIGAILDFFPIGLVIPLKSNCLASLFYNYFYNIIQRFKQAAMRQNGFSNNYVPSNTPNYFGHRLRLLSINTPKLSPLNVVQSPFPSLVEPNFFDSQLNMGNEFRLQEPQPTEEHVEPVNESEDQSYSELQFPKFPDNQEVTKDNMIDFLVATINIEQDRIQRVRQQMQNTGQTFMAEVFQYLYKRFKKTKKTKQEMIKYTMRKSFKFITDQMKKEDPSLIPILSTDGVQGMSIYFTKNSEDKQISIPFKYSLDQSRKNSAQKTMNTAFLKSVFSVQQFAKDYKRFLKTFQNEFIKDNKKKINSMSDAVKACINTKNYKSLQNYKRIPWTTDILAKLKSFAVDLLNYSPHKSVMSEQNEPTSKQKIEKQITKGNLVSQESIKPRKTSFQLSSEYYKPDIEHNGHRRSGSQDHFKDFINNEDDDEHDDLIHQLTQQKKVKKKSVIILTPPMLPLSDPPKLPEEEPLE